MQGLLSAAAQQQASRTQLVCCSLAAHLGLKLFSRICVGWVRSVILLLVLIKDLQAFLHLLERLLCRRQRRKQQRQGRSSRVHCIVAGVQGSLLRPSGGTTGSRAGLFGKISCDAPISCCSLRSELMTADRYSCPKQQNGGLPLLLQRCARLPGLPVACRCALHP